LDAHKHAKDPQLATGDEASLKVVTLPRVPGAREANPSERRIVRAEDLPPLPPDAFEILTSYVHDA
jgi:hypothetical protein